MSQSDKSQSEREEDKVIVMQRGLEFLILFVEKMECNF